MHTWAKLSLVHFSTSSLYPVLCHKTDWDNNFLHWEHKWFDRGFFCCVTIFGIRWLNCANSQTEVINLGLAGCEVQKENFSLSHYICGEIWLLWNTKCVHNKLSPCNSMHRAKTGRVKFRHCQRIFDQNCPSSKYTLLGTGCSKRVRFGNCTENSFLISPTNSTWIGNLKWSTLSVGKKLYDIVR